MPLILHLKEEVFSAQIGNTVVLSWTGSDGVPREEALTQSSYENNRRNDSGRNWGLSE